MACRTDDIPMEEILELLATEGMSGAREALRTLLNAAMRMERERHLKASAWERNENRQGHANGFKAKTISTRLGKIGLSIPQVRDSRFYPGALERGQRSERALTLALAEMYVQGVSTRKVSAIVEELCGMEVTSAQVSRATAERDVVLTAWRTQPWEECPYVFLDARYEKVREAGQVRDCAVLVAVGVELNGRRCILGASVALSEAEAHWRTFLISLQTRGLCDVRWFTCDAHEGLAAARQAVFPSVPYQRCQFHLQQNAQAYVPRKDLKEEVAAAIRVIFNAPDKVEADRLLKQTVASDEKSAPQLAQWMEQALPQGFTIFSFPAEHQKRLRTTNPLERLNREIKRRTQVATLFPNTDSCLRLVSAILMEISEDWQTAKEVYLSMKNGQ